MHRARRGVVGTGDETCARVRERDAAPWHRHADLVGVEIAGEDEVER